MEEKYLGYLIGSLDDEERLEVEASLVNRPEANAEVELLRQALEPLALDRDTIIPPADLFVRTIGGVAEYIVQNEGSVAPAGPPSPVAEFLRTLGQHEQRTGQPPVYPWHGSEANPIQYRRRDVATVFGLTTAALMIGCAAVFTLRQTQEVQACQNNMRQIYQGLAGYCDIHDNHFPQVEPDEDVRTALLKLRETGTMPKDTAFVCPGVVHKTSGIPAIDYAYHLGYRDEQKRLQGVSRLTDNDQFPIFADAPERFEHSHSTIPVNHRKGQNVLFAGGHVRFCTNPFVGPEMEGKGDDIYYNTAFQAHAGTAHWDIALGCASETP
jgi:prepilin-type processing-associated H-X9-DG protein